VQRTGCYKCNQAFYYCVSEIKSANTETETAYINDNQNIQLDQTEQTHAWFRISELSRHWSSIIIESIDNMHTQYSTFSKSVKYLNFQNFSMKASVLQNNSSFSKFHTLYKLLYKPIYLYIDMKNRLSKFSSLSSLKDRSSLFSLKDQKSNSLLQSCGVTHLRHRAKNRHGLRCVLVSLSH